MLTLTRAINDLLTQALTEVQNCRREMLGLSQPQPVEPPQWAIGLQFQLAPLKDCLALLESLTGASKTGSTPEPKTTLFPALPSPWDEEVAIAEAPAEPQLLLLPKQLPALPPAKTESKPATSKEEKEFAWFRLAGKKGEFGVRALSPGHEVFQRTRNKQDEAQIVRQVLTASGKCDCRAGQRGQGCRHQRAVAEYEQQVRAAAFRKEEEARKSERQQKSAQQFLFNLRVDGRWVAIGSFRECANAATEHHNAGCKRTEVVRVSDDEIVLEWTRPEPSQRKAFKEIEGVQEVCLEAERRRLTQQIQDCCARAKMNPPDCREWLRQLQGAETLAELNLPQLEAAAQAAKQLKRAKSRA